MEVEMIGVTNLSKYVSTDKITCCYTVGDLAAICREQVYISIASSQDMTQDGNMTDC